MCIAVYKPMGTDFPVKRVLKRCFYANPDGAGFMVATGSDVEIHKGYMGFRSFWKALRECRTKYGDDKAYVMHFRISTQGGIRQDGCHPFPLSKNMDDLRKLECIADIGVAHNGIIDLCTDWSATYSKYYTKSYSTYKQVDYSDTMKFITEYLSLIIHDRNYWENDDTIDLIDKLCESRLAILDGSGHCELIGYGWEKSDGVWYSNGSYKEVEPKETTTALVAKTSTGETTSVKAYSFWDEWYSQWEKVDEEDDDAWFDKYEDKYDPYADYLDEDGLYDFSQTDCPATIDCDDSYCYSCKHMLECWVYEDNIKQYAV